MWDVSNIATGVTMEGRLAFCSGLCHVLAVMPDMKGISAFETFASKPLDRLDRMVNQALSSRDANDFSRALLCIGNEIRVLSTMARSFTNAKSSFSANGYITCDMSLATRPSISVNVLDIIGKGWPNISHIAAHWSADKVSAERNLL
jgi:hypothetical protein